ncbi:hypothetical protein DIPPA_61435 [Diplonema papillatum]|nr:hypothetical protein DIPPA_61435 [Diplonema papillatum]
MMLEDERVEFVLKTKVRGGVVNGVDEVSLCRALRWDMATLAGEPVEEVEVESIAVQKDGFDSVVAVESVFGSVCEGILAAGADLPWCSMVAGRKVIVFSYLRREADASDMPWWQHLPVLPTWKTAALPPGSQLQIQKQGKDLILQPTPSAVTRTETISSLVQPCRVSVRRTASVGFIELPAPDSDSSSSSHSHTAARAPVQHLNTQDTPRMLSASLLDCRYGQLVSARRTSGSPPEKPVPGTHTHPRDTFFTSSQPISSYR